MPVHLGGELLTLSAECGEACLGPGDCGAVTAPLGRLEGGQGRPLGAEKLHRPLDVLARDLAPGDRRVDGEVGMPDAEPGACVVLPPVLGVAAGL